MLGESIFAGILAVLLAPALNMTTKVHNLAWEVQELYVDFKLVNNASQSYSLETVRDIETDSRSREIVRSFYLDSSALLDWSFKAFIAIITVSLFGLLPYFAIGLVDNSLVSKYGIIVQLITISLALFISLVSIKKVREVKQKLTNAVFSFAN